MKIIAGKFKGRNVIVPRGVRPVSLRVKKSCFDILREVIPDQKVLDLFAGSGSLGIEALSWGAQECTFIDSKRVCANNIKKNIAPLNIDSQVKIYNKDALDAIRDFHTYKESFDIVFLDPPYYKDMLIKTLQALEEYDILCPVGYIVGFCYFKDKFIQKSSKFSLIVEKKYGQTLVLIYRKG